MQTAVRCTISPTASMVPPQRSSVPSAPVSTATGTDPPVPYGQDAGTGATGPPCSCRVQPHTPHISCHNIRQKPRAEGFKLSNHFFRVCTDSPTCCESLTRCRWPWPIKIAPTYAAVFLPWLRDAQSAIVYQVLSPVRLRSHRIPRSPPCQSVRSSTPAAHPHRYCLPRYERSA